MLLLKTPLCYKLTFVSHSYVEMQTNKQTNKQIMEALTQNTKKPHKKHWNLATFWNEMSCFLHTFLICKLLCFCVCVSGVTHNVFGSDQESHCCKSLLSTVVSSHLSQMYTGAKRCFHFHFHFFMSLPFFYSCSFLSHDLSANKSEENDQLGVEWDVSLILPEHIWLLFPLRAVVNLWFTMPLYIYSAQIDTESEKFV